ncbi:hypothetical protein KM043_017078 [Ampulex compressa]|nr:hypothetical protein KM043_017078 [Ampulex compressa]
MEPLKGGRSDIRIVISPGARKGSLVVDYEPPQLGYLRGPPVCEPRREQLDPGHRNITRLVYNYPEPVDHLVDRCTLQVASMRHGSSHQATEQIPVASLGSPCSS